jgi:hypothetical protein
MLLLSIFGQSSQVWLQKDNGTQRIPHQVRLKKAGHDD